MTKFKTLSQVILFASLVFAPVISHAQSDPMDFVFVNYTGYEISGLYFAAPGGAWSRDFLGAGTLPNGYETQVRFNPQLGSSSCYRFIKVRYLDGSEQTSSVAWDLCAIHRVNFFYGYLTVI